MNTIKKEYANPNNGGREQISRYGDCFYINSYVPNVGWMGRREVSKDELEMCMNWTKAPADVVNAILA